MKQQIKVHMSGSSVVAYDADKAEWISISGPNGVIAFTILRLTLSGAVVAEFGSYCVLGYSHVLAEDAQ